MSALIRNILFAFGLALILWLGYTIFIRDSDELVISDSVSDAARSAQDFLVKLKKVEAIKISGEILRDDRFESLVNFRQEIVSEPTGRPNPFLPVDGAKKAKEE